MPGVIGVKLQLPPEGAKQISVPSVIFISSPVMPAPGGTTVTTAVTAIGEFGLDGFGVCAVIAVVVAALFTCKLPLLAPLLILAAYPVDPA